MLAGFREIREFLNIQVPAFESTIKVQKRIPKPAKQPNQPISLPKQLQTTLRASRVVPFVAEPTMQLSKNSSSTKSIFSKKSSLPPLPVTEQLTELDEPEIVTILLKPFGNLSELLKKYLAGRLVA